MAVWRSVTLTCRQPSSGANTIELALEQARYEEARSHRQYDAVDPENRLVAGDLERRWNERLAEVARLEEELRLVRENLPASLTETERAQILALGTDVACLWNHPTASLSTRKRILRTVLEEIIVTVEPGVLHVKLHWKGGDHTMLEVAKNRSGQHRWKTNATTEQLIGDLARLLPDGSIASLLNRLGMRTGQGPHVDPAACLCLPQRSYYRFVPRRRTYRTWRADPVRGSKAFRCQQNDGGTVDQGWRPTG
jgi:hypothetical protein